MEKNVINKIVALSVVLCLVAPCNASINLAVDASDGKINYVEMKKVLYGKKKSFLKNKWTRYGILVATATLAGTIAVKSNSHRHHRHHRADLIKSQNNRNATVNNPVFRTSEEIEEAVIEAIKTSDLPRSKVQKTNKPVFRTSEEIEEATVEAIKTSGLPRSKVQKTNKPVFRTSEEIDEAVIEAIKTSDLHNIN
jgi:hypothetical protein